MDWKLELVFVPVSDVDRAKAFYTDKIGFNADTDQVVSEGIRFVQLTPPGSACSIAIGEGLVDPGAGGPGSVAGLQIVVPSAARRVRNSWRGASRWGRSGSSRGGGSCTSPILMGTAGRSRSSCPVPDR